MTQAQTSFVARFAHKKLISRIMATKLKGVYCSTKFTNCSKRECFVPFSGNGQNICRLWELGLCKEGKVKKKSSKNSEVERIEPFCF